MSLIASPERFCNQDISFNDRELLQVCATFRALEAKVNRLLDVEHCPSSDPQEQLHGEWLAACSRAVQLTAHTPEKFHAKAAMLIEVLKVAAGNADTGANIHNIYWRLAASLACDVLEHSLKT